VRKPEDLGGSRPRLTPAVGLDAEQLVVQTDHDVAKMARFHYRAAQGL
jgi:hypothetical protein